MRMRLLLLLAVVACGSRSLTPAPTRAATVAWPVFVESDATNGVRVTSRAMPSSGRLVLRATSDLRHDADHSGAELPFLWIDHVDVVGDCATIGIVVDIMKPSNMDPYGLCCCSTDDVYTKQGGRWVYQRTSHIYCG